ncbi:MAG: ATP phosphoribosyltransferase [Lentisphaerae bacterium]|nr:ATP phosphoribosyltransferase [Lentisphaerota bacterium]
MKKLVLGLPKGSLQETTFAIMQKAGYTVKATSRSYAPDVDDPEIEARLLRAQEISRYVELGVLDAGITGHDWVVENGSDVHEVCELLYAKQGFRPVRWVLAVPEDSAIRRVEDLQGKRIATEAVGLTRRFLEERGVTADIEFSWGATEAKAPDLVDAIVELTETGSSLRANKLRIVEEVLQSTTRMIAGRAAWADQWKRCKIERLALLLKGALAAEHKVLLKMNVPTGLVGRVTDMLPSLHAPTVSGLAQGDWVAVETVIDENTVREIIPRLKEVGAEGIVELPINKIIA